MRLVSSILATLALAACSNPTTGLCGEGTTPEIVTGLNGVLEGGGPALEVQYRVPETCEVLGSRWILFDDPTQTLSIDDEPSGTLMRDRVRVEPLLVYFTDFAVGAELRYPDDVVGPQLTLVWSTGTGEPLGDVECVGDGETLSCTLIEP